MDKRPINKNLLLTSLLLILFGYSCSESDSIRITNNLIGTWKIDSVTFPQRKYLKNDQGQWIEDCSSNLITQNGEFKKNEPCQHLIFHNITDYSKIGTCGDVHQNFRGKYYILNNPKRGLGTLTLIPDIYISNNDTIRIAYVNMDIVSIQNDRLVLISETQWGK